MKGIIVVDIPLNCLECKISEKVWRGKLLTACPYFGGLKKEPYKMDENCPIKPMPEKMEVLKIANGIVEIQEKAFALGWNSCVDELLKGEHIE